LTTQLAGGSLQPCREPGRFSEMMHDGKVRTFGLGLAVLTLICGPALLLSACHGGRPGGLFGRVTPPAATSAVPGLTPTPSVRTLGGTGAGTAVPSFRAPTPMTTAEPESARTSTPVPPPSVVPASGGRIAFASDRDGSEQIHVMNADGSDVVRLTTGPSTNTGPAWSPDGCRLVFVSDRDGHPNIY
jgi:hypothetical protein